MTNNSDGLSPTLRPQLGVGWNRALPTPFGFDNGFEGNGSGYFVIPRLIGTMVPNDVTFEVYFKNTKAAIQNNFFQIGGDFSTANPLGFNMGYQGVGNIKISF